MEKKKKNYFWLILGSLFLIFTAYSIAYDSGYYDVSDILLTKENEKYKGSIKEEKNDDDNFDEDMKDEKEENQENK